MKIHSRVLTAIVVYASALAPSLTLTSCTTLSDKKDAPNGFPKLDDLGLKAPEISITSLALTGLSVSKVAGTLKLAIKNPSPVPLPLGQVRFGLKLLDEDVQSGTLTPSETLLNPGKSIDLEFPLAFRLEAIASVLRKSTSLTEIPYVLNADVSVGSFSVPVSQRGKVPKPVPPTIGIERLKVEKAGLDETEMSLSFHVQNRNAFPLRLGKFTGAIGIGGEPATFATSADFDTVAAGGGTNVKLPFRVSTRALGAGALSVFSARSDGGTKSVRLDGTFTHPSFLPGRVDARDEFTRTAELPLRP